MIKYALICGLDHEFEAWFASSGDFDQQAKTEQVSCPVCGDENIRKQVMAPALKGTRKKSEDSAQTFSNYARQVRAQIESSHEYVGDQFADRARAMHEGREEEAPIYGEVTREEAGKLAEEGVPAAALPEPFVPKKGKKLN